MMELQVIFLNRVFYQNIHEARAIELILSEVVILYASVNSQVFYAKLNLLFERLQGKRVANIAIARKCLICESRWIYLSEKRHFRVFSVLAESKGEVSWLCV